MFEVLNSVKDALTVGDLGKETVCGLDDEVDSLLN